ncbi:predicted protein [Nematostella vectensis]|uniref:Uncharacterized protein n=1 Tax=Nematostella vectensis TaxID=45351 RepID=A7SKN1_NEMVE|nr:predicted protein [Nematostella vectensis]|eukprot:XP_001647544.1 predicted protein [Nematostella vectensis]
MRCSVIILAGAVLALLVSHSGARSVKHQLENAPKARPDVHKKSHLYHSKSHKRHIRKKKQYIIPGLGGYGYGMGALGMGGNGLTYGATPGASYGYAQSDALGQGLVPSQRLVSSPNYGYSNQAAMMPVESATQSRQSLLNSYSAGAGGLAGYSPGYSAGANTASYASDPSYQSSLSNGLGSSLSNGMSSSLSNGLSSSMTNGFSSSLSNGMSPSLSQGLSSSLSNGLSSYTGGSDTNGLGSLAAGYSQGTGSDLNGGGLGPGKISASALSAGLDSPNGISNVANFLSSENTAFDSDSQNQLQKLLSSNQDLNALSQQVNSPSSLAQYLSNQGSPSTGSQSLESQSQSTGSQSYGQQSALEAEAQAFNNQLSRLTSGKLNLEELQHSSRLAGDTQSFNSALGHLSSSKINLQGNDHANYGENGINELGQLANTGLSDSSIQRLIGQLLAGQGGGSHEMGGGMEEGAGGMGGGGGAGGGGEFDDQRFEDAQSPEEEQPGFLNSMLDGGGIGHTIHVHASDKPRPSKVRPSKFRASEKAFRVQLKAKEEHQLKLKQLKEKLRRLRAKLHKLKDDYDSEDYEDQQSDLSEKSEMQTLNDLKVATEQAIRDLQHEVVKAASKRKGVRKLIFVHKFTDSSEGSGKAVAAKKAKNGLEDQGSDLLELIESDEKTGSSKSSVKHKDDTSSLTQLEKQAEQEVNFLTRKDPKGVALVRMEGGEHKQANVLNPGLHIHVPEPMMEDGQTHSKILKHKSSKSSGGESMFSDGSSSDGLGGLSELLKNSASLTTPQAYLSYPGPHGLNTGYFSIGCWRDEPDRALASMESIFPILDGADYKNRRFSVRKCAQVARVQGFPAFAVENGGQCLGGKNIMQKYHKYGASHECRRDGKGGPWSMEVYKFTVATSLEGRRGEIPRFGGSLMPQAREIFYQAT